MSPSLRHLAFLIGLGLGICGTSSAPAVDGYTLAVDNVTVDPGADFALPVLGEWADPVMGYTIVVQFPTSTPFTNLDISIDNTITAEIEPEFVVGTTDPLAGEMVLAVLFELLPPFDVTLEVLGIPLALAEISGTVDGAADEQTVPFDLVDGIGDPPANNIFVVDNQSFLTESLTGGGVTVAPLDPPEPQFIRSDVNLDGVVTIADVIFHLNYTFVGGPPPECDDAADANDDGSADITDGIFTLNYLFVNGPQPWPPFPNPGPDYTPDDLGCESSPF